ncbi:Coiled-coil domain containing 129, partial [Pristimantis euphronides]
MGMITLSVKDYMSSLHNYMEALPKERIDGTMKSAPSLPKSISDMLKLCEADPVDLLIDLGFGIDEPDICTKIPPRFIMTPSEAKGINTRVFLEAQKKRMEIENPNVCGRFRQLEVLEQVTSAFSSLLNNIHTIQNEDGKNANSERKQTLTPDKRKRIRQLLWKFSKQVKIADENLSPAMTTAELGVPEEDHEYSGPTRDSSNLKVFRKRKYSTEENSLVTLSAGSTLSDGQENEALSPSTPMKQCSHFDTAGKVRTPNISKTFKKTTQHRLQPPNPESFEMEEVLSFEEDCPKTMNQDSISEMTRTNSCQSDSSGFQEEPPEPLPLQNLHESSDSTDSQTTVREKADVTISNDECEEYDAISHVTDPLETCENMARSGLKGKKEKYKSLSMNIENSDDSFQSFDYADKDNIQEPVSQDPASEDPGNEACSDSNSGLLRYDLDGSVCESQAESLEVPSKVDFPVYVTHYLSDTRESILEPPCQTNDSLMPDFSEECVSGLPKSESERDSFADDECSVELSNLKWSPSPTSDIVSQVHTPEGSVDFSDEELNTSYQDTKSRFQTEINTNIYKSVTIQMSPNLLQEANDASNRPNTAYNTSTNGSEVHALQCDTECKEVFSQTDTGGWNEDGTNNHRSHRPSCYLTESLSFDTALWLPHHSPSLLRTHCCYCCHCHHFCTPRSPPSHRHNVSMRPSGNINLEKELSDTLRLLRKSLLTVSLNTDRDVENMKQACQKYREKLIEIEQRLTEQHSGCYNMFTREERESLRRLHLLRQSVLKEALELEVNLDARARQVKETIS